ncbi:hypothetical protein CW304_12055 [Bacillus sp. UFRGS-B20]|nr:hypothetical protein CW304_12055 [Bacillus sp. UFRGS-B20]
MPIFVIGFEGAAVVFAVIQIIRSFYSGLIPDYLHGLKTLLLSHAILRSSWIIHITAVIIGNIRLLLLLYPYQV